MFRKYEKTYRARIPGLDVPGKFCLTKDELHRLLNGEVFVEEKMDGANVGIIRHKKGFTLQKRGSLVGASEHAQFQFFHNWANYQNYTKLMALPEGFTVYGELLYAVHSIYYGALPDWVLVFEVWDSGREKYLDYPERYDFCHNYGLEMVPLVAQGYFRVEELASLVPKESAYGEMAEGIVLKRYRKGECLRGKIVKPEFIKMLEESEHWVHNEIRRNNVQTQRS
ncbi:MAG: RNA ligase family protein [Nitrospira sp.]|nr:RNA ligase family protein [Nitrospira sp.]